MTDNSEKWGNKIEFFENYNWQWRMTELQLAELETMAPTLKTYALQYDR
jgi:hypothetical protein